MVRNIGIIAFVIFGIMFLFATEDKTPPTMADDNQHENVIDINNEISLNIDMLEQISYNKMSIPDLKTIDLMNSIAVSKRIDALTLLIKCLAYNLKPRKNHEDLSQESMIPAIYIIKNNYGILSLSNLFVEGICTDKKWMRERCALAIRVIASQDELEKYIKIFSLTENTTSNGKAFKELLTQKQIQVELYDPEKERMKILINGIIEYKLKQNEVKDKENVEIKKD